MRTANPQRPIRYPLTLPADLLETVAERANDLGESMATWIRAAIREKLERDATDS